MVGANGLGFLAGLACNAFRWASVPGKAFIRIEPRSVTACSIYRKKSFRHLTLDSSSMPLGNNPSRKTLSVKNPLLRNTTSSLVSIDPHYAVVVAITGDVAEVGVQLPVKEGVGGEVKLGAISRKGNRVGP